MVRHAAGVGESANLLLVLEDPAYLLSEVL